MAEINDLAKADAQKIAKDLIERYAGMRIRKGDIRRAFDIPVNRSVYVFSWLVAKHGFQLEHQTMLVPLVTKESTTPQ